MSEVTVVLSVSEVAVTKVSQEVGVAAPGPQGPPGPAGSSSGSVLVHDQSSPAGTWIINHGLSRPVTVTVLNSSGEQIIADVDQSDPDTVSIIFATPTSGKAVVI